MKTYTGTVLFLDRADINTDEIIPAKYLTEISKEALKPHLLEDLELPGFDPASDIPGSGVIVTRDNFGSGSSREHAPWALEVNGITVVAAPSFARIFRQNMFNNGLLAAEVDPKEIESLFKEFAGSDTQCRTDLEKSLLVFRSGNRERSVPFRLGPYDRALVEAGGWVEFADSRY
jgi:3-isopropylmalate/(R)-2-methylmalate dehydratase small subunit